MPRITKAILEENVRFYRGMVEELERKNTVLMDKLKWLESHSESGQTATMAIAMERISQAMAETLKISKGRY